MSTKEGSGEARLYMPIEVECPRCGVRPLEQCRYVIGSRTGGVRTSHPQRIATARILSATPPTGDPAATPTTKGEP